MALAKVVQDIRTLKIQGAQHIALAAVQEFHTIIKRHAHSPKLLAEVHSAHQQLIAARPTEPFLRNCLNAIVHVDRPLTAEELLRRVKLVEQYIANADAHIITYARKFIPKQAVIYTHCHSTTVTRIIIDAAKRSKITVHNTETRPRFQGRITAAELAKAKVPVLHFVDAAMRLAMKHCTMALLGADAITTDGKVVNKIGSELVAETAARFGVPLYICTNSWKFDPATAHAAEPIEERDNGEVWKGAPKGVKIRNPAFERIHPKLITGIISEMGIHSPKTFVKEVQDRYPLLKH